MSQLVGPGAIAQAGATSVFFSTPFPHKPGDKARDTEGNEFVFVDFTSTVYYGCLVQINSLYQAAPLLGTANRPYRVGVVCSGTPTSDAGNHPTSDNGGWVQVYGVHPAVQTETATDGGVSATAGGAYFCIPQTAVGTPSGVLAVRAQATAVSVINTSTEGNQIYGMWVVDFAEVSDLPGWVGSSGASGPSSMQTGNDTSGAATSAFIGQTYACFLNYPYVLGISVPMVNATSDS
jgi:hypothetical protein